MPRWCWSAKTLPVLAFAKVAALFAEEPPAWERGVHASAVVAPSAKLGNNVSIGANAVIENGAEIGDNTVIGAGSVVTKDIPANVIAVGVPCRVMREITEADRDRYPHYNGE